MGLRPTQNYLSKDDMVTCLQVFTTIE